MSKVHKNIQEALVAVQTRINEQRQQARQQAVVHSFLSTLSEEQIESLQTMNEEELQEFWGVLARGAITAAKNLGRNFTKGLSGSTTNVTRSSAGKFASPGGASKVGEKLGQGAKVVKDNPGKAGLAAGAAIGAGTTAALMGKNKSADADAAENTPMPPRRPANLGTTPSSSANAPAAKAPKAAPVPPQRPQENPYEKHGANKPDASPADFFRADKEAQQRGMVKGPENPEQPEGESKGKRKKQMKESALINAFFKLQESKANNLFVEAKKMTKKDIAALEDPEDKIDAKDLAALRAGKHKKKEKEEKGEKEVNEAWKKESGNDLPPQTAVERVKSKLGLGPKSTTTGDAGIKYSDKDREEMNKKAKEVANEEVEFSEAELAHFDSIFEGRKKKDDEEREISNVAAQARTSRERGGVISLTHPTTKKVYNVPTGHVNKFNSSYASAEKPTAKQAIEKAFIEKHMSS